jgi:DNA-binding XRE family transcriptional regulator
MDTNKREALEKAGWQIGTVDEFLNLTPEESAYIELKLTLANHLRARRQEQHLTQVELASRLQSSQSRIAKMEAGDPSVSLDLLVRSLLALGTSQKDLAMMLAG